MNHILKIKKLNENAVVPAQATAGSAGMVCRHVWIMTL